MILVMVLCAIFADFIAPYPEHVSGTDFATGATPPSLQHPMGTDTAGRDIFSRILFGARISLMIGFTVIAIATTIGTIVGLTAGYLGGWVRAILMRITDVFLAVPPTVLALAVAAALGPNLRNVMIAVAFSWWTWYARLIAGEVISVKEEQFVEAVIRRRDIVWVRDFAVNLAGVG